MKGRPYLIEQFADDTIVFCKADLDQIRNTKRVLRCFEAMLGLEINFKESKICGVGVDDDFVEQARNILSWKSGSLPIKYLGLPVGSNPKSIKCWKPVLDRLERKLAMWKSDIYSWVEG